MDQFLHNALETSKQTTLRYSTSFSMGVRLFHRRFRYPIYAVYGFVRYADEIVDTFFDQDQARLLEDFRRDTFEAIHTGISMNPILHSFQWVVHQYGIEKELIEAFLDSMVMDLRERSYDYYRFKKYVYGSAEVVGLMCLRVFTEGNDTLYRRLEYPARKLGEAFQKVNFLRDIKEDFLARQRVYFPYTTVDNFKKNRKVEIERDIAADFRLARPGLMHLPRGARLGVYLAYRYYLLLLHKIRKTPPENILTQRYRIPDYQKVLILIRTWLFPPFPKKMKGAGPIPRVEIDPGAGFCFGVTGAIHHAEEELEKSRPLYCLGQIVHNDEEVQRLHDMGMVTIEREQLPEVRDARVLFRAHGEPVESYRVAATNGNSIIDASCPIILKLQERIRRSHENGETILIYGKENHPEVIGLNSKADNQAVVFRETRELDLEKLPQKISLYSQTTMDIESFYLVIEQLRQAGKQVEVHDTICREVSGRRTEMEAFAKAYDQVVFIAGKNSSNGRVLYEICRRYNHNTLFITFKEELLEAWRLNGHSIGITGATSTPRWLMEAVRDRILEKMEH